MRSGSKQKKARSPHFDWIDSFLDHEQMEKVVAALRLGDVDLAVLALAEARVVERQQKEKPNKRVPGRFRSQLVVGPDFFKPLTDDEIKEFVIE
ncbi:hypothetical protein [Agrobacterium rosae]|uniref:hypothetical protein n=1 Tax=Agrobacterium rosae TaxID=1972867 RepID=UPI003BA063A7